MLSLVALSCAENDVRAVGHRSVRYHHLLVKSVNELLNRICEAPVDSMEKDVILSFGPQHFSAECVFSSQNFEPFLNLERLSALFVQ